MPKPLKIIGVIPARWASTRFPGKPLALIAGKPLLQWVVERSRQARGLSEILVATDDDRIAGWARGFGVPVAMTRPDHPSGSDRIAEAAHGRGADVIINIQGDEPLIDPKLIDALGAVFVGGAKWEMATAATPIRGEEWRDPSVVKVVCGRDGQALYFSRSPIPCVRDADAAAGEPVYWRHVGIYAYAAGALARFVAAPPCRLEQLEKLEQLRALDMGYRIQVLPVEAPGPGVDTPADVPRAEAALRAAGLA